MGSLARKIDALKQDIRLLGTWGPRLGVSRLFLDCFVAEQRDKSSFLQNISAKRQKLIAQEIERYYPDIIKESYETLQGEPEEQTVITRECPIWVFWWQGMDNAPEIVKVCADSIKKNKGSHTVNILDKDNYSDYIAMPDYVIAKLNAGKMTVTHFSDLLRFALLYKYGGIWMDATIYLSRPFDDEVYDHSLFTIKSSKPDGRRWSSFFWVASKRNESIRIIRDFFYNYWKCEDGLIDYFLINSVVMVTYRKNEGFRNLLDSIPPSNSDVMVMFENLNNADGMLHISDDTYINKLSYKRNWVKSTPQGELTVYGALLAQKRDSDGSILI